jgi:hypothetical protein
MLVHVLLYDAGGESEGIHSLELAGSTVVLMFENRDDAERYAGLLEAQDFPVPSLEAIERDDIEIFCREAGYVARFVESGFVPETDEERLLLSPPTANRDVTGWQDAEPAVPSDESAQLEAFRRQLENLL